MMWLPIETAAKSGQCNEFIGSKWIFDKDGSAKCIKEPFISFWSPSLGKFFAEPTHWTELPAPPFAPKTSPQKEPR